MIDNIFGELIYCGGWTKIEKINLWNQENDIKLVVSAYENEEPNEAQRDAYKRLKKDLEEISKFTLKKLRNYMNGIQSDILAYANVPVIPDDIFELVSISEIIFIENGSFGIMCKTKWDSHGVAVLCRECEVEVGPQDIVWLDV